MVKESIFNMLAGEIESKRVLDVFAGSGSMGIEALSRGATFAVFLDKSHECCKIIKENLLHTKLADRAEVYCTDYAVGIQKLAKRGEKFDIIILDPPYNKNFIQEALKILTNNDIMGNKSIVIAEHSVKDSLPEAVGSLRMSRTRKYGNTAVTIYVFEKDGNGQNDFYISGEL